MINMLSMCDRSAIVMIMLIIKTFFKIACYVIPMIIIIVTIIGFTKPIIDGKSESLVDNWKLLVKRLIAGLLIFFLPTIISYVFTSIVKADDVEFITCFETASKERVASLKAKEEAALEAEKKAQEKEDAKTAKEAYAKDEKIRKNQKTMFEEQKKKREEEERKKRQQQAALSGGGSVLSDVPSGTVNIIIGDSRTVGMCASMTGDWTKCQFSNGGKSNGSDFYIAQGSMGYSWFNSTAVSAVNRILAENPGTKYNIFSLMGVNFLLSDIDKYIPTYNNLSIGAWKDHKIILVSVTPVNEAIEAQNGYSTKNANIETFNAKLKNGVRQSNVSYCDVYGQMGSNFGTGDGLHYDGPTYKRIYSMMMACK